MPPNGISAVAPGDFNNDGNLDAVVVGSYGGYVLLGDGRGDFARTNFDVSYSTCVAVGDFNDDGKLDFAVGHDGRLLVAAGKGDGSFGNPTNYSILRTSSGIAVGDIHGDGKSDLIVSLEYSSSNSVCVLTNRGNGAFAAPQYAYSKSDYHYAPLLADFNEDGSLDLAVLNYNAGSATIHLNNGKGIFGQPNEYLLNFPPHYPSGFLPASMVSADFNCDGDIDLVIAGSWGLRALLGHGNGSFSVATPFFGSGSDCIVTGDFNGDALPDIAFASAHVVVRLNQTTPLLEISPMPGYSQISWLAGLGKGFALQWTTNLSAQGSWQPFSYPPVLIGNQKAVADWADGEKKFYRLRRTNSSAAAP